MSKIKILIVEDDPDHAFLEQDILLDELACEVSIVSKGADLLNEQIGASDIMLIDFNLPDTTGAELIERIRRLSDVPVIVITGDDQINTAVATLKHGANEFLSKSPSNISMLPGIVERVLAQHQNRKKLEQESREKAELETKIETLRQVLTTLAHYINNATTTIFGYAQLVSNEPENQSRSMKLAQVSLKETRKITYVLQELERFVSSMEIKTTNYVNIPNAMFEIEENIKKRMQEISQQKE